MNKKAVVDMETGEILKTLEYGDTIRSKKQNEYVKNALNIEITEEMLNYPTKEFILKLYKKMKITGKINRYGFIYMNGVWVKPELFKLLSDNKKFSSEMVDLFNRVSIRNFIKKDNGYTEVENWKDLYSVLEIKNRNKCSDIKKFLTENNIVRLAYRPNKKSVLVLNPNYIRFNSWISDFSIATFKDCTLDKIDYENSLLLFFNGLIEKNDIESLLIVKK